MVISVYVYVLSFWGLRPQTLTRALHLTPLGDFCPSPPVLSLPKQISGYAPDENDGPSKLQDMKLMDQCAGLKMQDRKMIDQFERNLNGIKLENLTTLNTVALTVA